MKTCVLSVSALLLCVGLASGGSDSDVPVPPVAVWPADLEYDPSLIDLSEPETPEWVERLRANRGEPDCELIGNPDTFDYVVRLTTWPGLVADRVVYIDASAPVGGDGTSWGSAYQSLHDALNAESFETELVDIRLAQGLYRADRVNGVDTLDADLTYQLPGITVTDGVPTGLKRVAGGFAGRNAKDPDRRDPNLFPTVFTGDLLGNDTDQHENYEENTKVMFEPGLTELNGITIEHGRVAINEGRWITDCTVRWCYAIEAGFPSPNSMTSPVLARDARVFGCVFAHNKCDTLGGALKPEGETIVVANSRFLRNESPSGGAIGGRPSFSDTPRLIVQNCFFVENVSDGPRGGLGGAIRSSGSNREDTQIVHSSFVGNVAVAGGGNGAVSTGRAVSCFNSIFDQNFAYNGTGIEAEINSLLAFNTTNESQVSGNVFRRYNENLDNEIFYQGHTLNKEAVPGFASLYGPDGELGTLDDSPALGQGAAAIGQSVQPPAFSSAQNYQLGLFDIADLDGDCDRTEPLPIDIFGNHRAFESTPGEGVDGYPADAGCAEFVPDGRGLPAQDWIVPDREIVDFSTDPIRLYVDIGAPPDGDGSSWAAALTDPAEALAIARRRTGPVEIWVATGVYPAPRSSSNVGGFQMVENATLLGGFVGNEEVSDQRDPVKNLTILTGDVLGNDSEDDPDTLLDNTDRVIVSIGRRGGGTVDGFYLTGGSPRTQIVGAGFFPLLGWQEARAPGIAYAASGTLSIQRSRIGPPPLSNRGGGIERNAMLGLQGQQSNLVLNDCELKGALDSLPSNYASVVVPRSDDRVTVQPSEDSGSLLVDHLQVDLGTDRRIFKIQYGGIAEINNSVLVSRSNNSLFLDFDNTRSVSLENTQIVASGGLVLRFNRSGGVVDNCTLTAPSFTVQQLDTFQELSFLVRNNVFGGSSHGIIPSSLPSADVLIAGNTFPATMTPEQLEATGPTNTVFDFASNAAAFFLNPLGPDGLPYTGDEDLRLAPGSPAINTGLNAFVDSQFDLDGNDRIIAHVVDRGAYEFTGTCTGDVNGDSVIDLADLNLVLSNFGEDLPFGDASGDGAVDLVDLNAVLAAFGQLCP